MNPQDAEAGFSGVCLAGIGRRKACILDPSFSFILRLFVDFPLESITVIGFSRKARSFGVGTPCCQEGRDMELTKEMGFWLAIGLGMVTDPLDFSSIRLPFWELCSLPLRSSICFKTPSG